MLRNAAFASSVVASVPTVLPRTRLGSASCCSTHVNTASWTSTLSSRRVREIVEWSARRRQRHHTQERPQAQRIGRPPRDRPFRVQTFEILDEQQPELAARRQARPPHPRIERGAQLLNEGIEARRAQYLVQPARRRDARRPGAGPPSPPTSLVGTRRRGSCPSPWELSVVQEIGPVDPGDTDVHHGLLDDQAALHAEVE